MENSKFQLNEKRAEWFMKAIAYGKYININYFLNFVGIERSAFNNHVKKIAISNPNLYAIYNEQLNKNLEQFIDERGDIITYIEDMITNGVEFKNGMIGKFEVVDWFIKYYEYFEGVNKMTLSKIIEERDKKMAGKAPRAVHARKLISRATNPQMGSYYNSITKGHILLDKEYGLTDEEKYVIINLFEKYNIPYNYSTFDSAARRVLDYRSYCFTNSCELDYSTCFSIDDVKTRKRVR